jgi:transcriptional regulator of acetoin/glycerol metabolism
MHDEIVASWSRSVRQGLRKDQLSPPYAPERAVSRIAEVARPVLDRVSDDLVGTRVSLVLADDRARVVERRIDDLALRATLDDVGLSPGHDWSERSVGTNAVGTALECAAPLVVSGSEHYADALAAITTAAATISEPRTGQVLGVIALTCATSDASALMLPYTRRIGREIEDRLLDDASAAERTMLEHFMRTRRHTRGPIVSVNKRSMITNAAAARLVGDADRALLWDWAEAAMTRGQDRSDEFRLTSGTAVSARCEPVRIGSEVVGALVRLGIRARAVDDTAPRKKSARQPRVGWAGLSAAQLGIAELVATGLTNQEAATRLFVSQHTIDAHLRQIFNKLGICSRVELARIVAERHAAQEHSA